MLRDLLLVIRLKAQRRIKTKPPGSNPRGPKVKSAGEGAGNGESVDSLILSKDNELCFRYMGHCLVCSGCYRNIPHKGWLVDNRLFHRSREGQSKVMGTAQSGSGENSLPGCRLLTSHCVLAQQGAQGVIRCLLHKGRNPIQEGSTLMT